MLKQAVFELQEQYRMIQAANHLPYSKKPMGKDFAVLEQPMKLSEYACIVTLPGGELQLQPFSDLPNGLSPWYLEGIPPLGGGRSYLPKSTMANLLLATAALRCLLYAQFGPQSEQAIAPSWKNGSQRDYYRTHSIFSVIPPEWPKSQWYDFPYTPSAIQNIRSYLPDAAPASEGITPRSPAHRIKE